MTHTIAGRLWVALALALLLLALGLGLRGGDGAAAAIVASLGVLTLGIAAWEHGPSGAKEVALVAAYGSVAAAGRVIFGFVPSVQPVTTMTACAGVALGPRAGAAVGGIAALVSNGFLGQGPWTPWQMLAWGLVGASAAWLAPLLRRRLSLVVFVVVWGFLYGALLDAWELLAFGPAHTWGAYTASWLRGLSFDVAHATGNAVIAAAVGPALIRLLDRYGRRLDVHIEWDASVTMRREETT